ncbi:MAG: hypothetical protein KC466_05985 [Myxococcales bacterium]|nr:hypothetical protein [Myxococcales bacterium]
MMSRGDRPRQGGGSLRGPASTARSRSAWGLARLPSDLGERAIAYLHDLKTLLALVGLALVVTRALVGARGPFASPWAAFPLYLGFPLLVAALLARGLHGTADPGARLTPEAAPKSRRMRLVWAGMIVLSGLFFLPHAVFDWRSVDLPLLDRLDNGAASPLSWRAAVKVPPPVTGDVEIPTFRPLTWALWWGLELCFGSHPVPYGLATLAFHMMTVAMVIALVLFYTGGNAGALIAGGLVAFSPLALRAAAGRDALGLTMAAFFILGAVHQFRAWQISNRPGGPWLATLCAALACLSHEIGLVTLPLLAYLSLARDRLCYRAPEERLSAMVPALAVAGLYLGACALVAIVNRETILGLVRETLTANFGDIFLWRVPYELLARLPNVLALGPQVATPGPPAQRLYWVAFGGLLFALAMRGQSFRLTTGLGAVLLGGGALYAVAPPTYPLARIDGAWTSGEAAYLPLIGLALIIGGMVPKSSAGTAKDIRVAGALVLLLMPAITIRTAWRQPPRSEFHEACAEALDRLVADMGTRGEGVLIDARNRCAWTIALRRHAGTPEDPGARLRLFSHGVWTHPADGSTAEAGDRFAAVGGAPLAGLMVRYDEGPRVERVDDHLVPSLSKSGAPRSSLSRSDAAGGLEPWRFDGIRPPLLGQPLRFRAGYRRQGRLLLTVDLDPAEVAALVIHGRRIPKRPGHPRSELQPVATVRWRSGGRDEDLVYRDFQTIRVDLPESDEAGAIVVELASHVGWRVGGRVRELEIAFDRVSSDFEIHALEVVGAADAAALDLSARTGGPGGTP